MKTITPQIAFLFLLSCSCHHGVDSSYAMREQDRLNRLMKAYLLRVVPYTQDRLRAGYAFEFRGPMTINQLEHEMLEGLTENDKKDLSPVFSDLINEKWLHRRGHYYMDGDEFYFFRTEKRSWDALVGFEGYLLLRKGEIVDVLATGMQ